MATTTVILTNGIYSYEDSTIRSNGSVNLFTDVREIQRVDGTVFDGDATIGNFSAYRDGTQSPIRYSISFTDPSLADELSQTAYAVAQAVEAQL